MADTLDAIHIRDLQFRCIIGVNEDERREKQDIVMNLTLYINLRAVTGELMLKQLREATPLKRSKAMRERWEKVKQIPALALKDSLSRQVASLAKRFYASKYLYDATRQQNRWNYEQAKKIKQDLFNRIDKGEKFDPDLKLLDLIKPNTNLKERIREA